MWPDLSLTGLVTLHRWPAFIVLVMPNTSLGQTQSKHRASRLMPQARRQNQRKILAAANILSN
jgi:hypothetical protein